MKFLITQQCRVKGEVVKEGQIVEIDKKYAKSLIASGRGVPHQMEKGEKTFKFNGKTKGVSVPKGKTRAQVLSEQEGALDIEDEEEDEDEEGEEGQGGSLIN